MCCCQIEGTHKAILNAMVSMVFELPAKASTTLYKETREVRGVGDRKVAIAGVNTCTNFILGSSFS